MSVKPQPTYSPLQIWILASRPKTLPAATAPVIVGLGVALSQGVASFLPALAALLGALLLQIGANLANDVFDFKKGADKGDRLGPLRVTQAGLLSPEQVMAGMGVVFGLATLIGLYLVWVAGWPIVLIGLCSILAALAYTGGPYPLGYNGLGDIFVFIFFGPVAVCGTYYVQALTVSRAAWVAAIPIGLLATAILVVNNLRDVDTDRQAGKRTIAVRLGRRGAQIEYALLLAGAYLVPPLMWLCGLAGPGVLLAWLSALALPPLLRLIFTQQGKILNKALAQTGQIELLYAVLFSVGLVISH